MTVKVKLFAAAREITGSDELEVELAEGATFGDLRQQMTRLMPQIAPVCQRAMFAADARYVYDQDLVPQECDIALIPPVSGG